jgi:phosphate transport system protein
MSALRTKFEQGLDELEALIHEMYTLTKESYDNILIALKNNDIDLAMKVIRRDEEINNLEEQVNEDGILLIAKQAPVALDLRRIMTAIKIASDMERIADYSVNIAKYITKQRNSSPENFKIVEGMVLLLNEMLDEIIVATENNDVKLSKEVAEKDSVLDKLYKENVRALIKITRENVDEASEEAMNTILIVKQLERAGDHVTNIAENIIYLVKGKRYDLN